MTPTEMAERIIRIDERTERTEKILIGNGQPGLIDKFATLKSNHQLVYDRQKTCQAGHKANKLDVKWLILLVLMIATFVAEYFK